MANPSKTIAPSPLRRISPVQDVHFPESINSWHLLAIAGVAFLAMLPAFSYGIFKAHDLTDFHLRWAKQFSEQFWAGELYPRWLLGMNAGMGSPTFMFYAPVPYYFTSLLRPLVVGPDPYGWHQLSLGAYTGLWLSGTTAYLWLRSWLSNRVSLFGAVLYMIAPYHLAVDLYARFTYGEFWGFVWLPLILLFTQKLMAGQRLAIAGFAITEALLIMTHLPCYLIFVSVPVLYGIWLTPKARRSTALVGIILGSLLAVGLAAIYWLTAITSLDFVTHPLDRHAYFADNFLFVSHAEGQALQSFWAYLETLTVFMVLLGGCAAAIANRHPSVQIRQQSQFWCGMIALAVVMSTPVSYPLWKLIPILQKMELPWRFHILLVLAASVLVALACLSLPQVLRWHRHLVLPTSLIVGGGLLLSGFALVPVLALLPAPGRSALLGSIPWHISGIRVLWVALLCGLIVGLPRIKGYVPRIQSKAVVSSLLLGILLLVFNATAIRGYLRPPVQLDAQLAISRDALAHRPQWIPKPLYTLNGLRQLSDRFGTAPTLEAQTQVKASLWQPRKLTLETQLDTDQWLTVRQFYYPGWTASLADRDAPDRPTSESESLDHTQPERIKSLAIRPSAAEGLIQVNVPAGRHHVMLVLHPVAQEQQAQQLSAVTAIGLVLIVGWYGIRSRQKVAGGS
jgi:hypothetical protein